MPLGSDVDQAQRLAAGSILETPNLTDELAYILDLSRQLPLPPARPVTRTALAELAAWQNEMDNAAFVWAILTLLGQEPPLSERPPDDPTNQLLHSKSGAPLCPFADSALQPAT
jgi:hypothetical protein